MSVEQIEMGIKTTEMTERRCKKKCDSRGGGGEVVVTVEKMTSSNRSLVHCCRIIKMRPGDTMRASMGKVDD